MFAAESHRRFQSHPTFGNEVMGDSRVHFDGWRFNEGVLQPGADLACDYNAHSELSETEDCAVHFVYPDGLNFPTFTIAPSVLAGASEPFAALLNTAFREANERKVVLSPEDDPTTFGALVSFLRREKIALELRTLDELLRIVRSAHRWDLGYLADKVCLFISAQDMLHGFAEVLCAKDIVSLPEISEQFVSYFWQCTVDNFDDLSSQAPSKSSTDAEGSKYTACSALDPLSQSHDSRAIEESIVDLSVLSSRHVGSWLCPRFPDMWEAAFSQGAARVLDIVCAIARQSRWNQIENLVELTAKALEPSIADDGDLLRILTLLVLDEADCAEDPSLLLKQSAHGEVSQRASRLFAKAVSFSSLQPLERRYSFEADLRLGSWEAKDIGYDCLYALPPQGEKPRFAEKVWFLVRLRRTAPRSFAVELTGQVGSKVRERKLGKELAVSISVVDNGCCCSYKQSHSARDSNRTLYRMENRFDVASVKLRARGSMPYAVLKRYDERHEKGAGCTVTIRLRVRVCESEGADTEP